MKGETMRGIMGLAMLAGLLLAPAAGAAVRDSITKEEVAAALRAVGATDVSLERDAAGDPMVAANLHDADFQVLMYDCSGDRCASIQFRSGYDLDDGMSWDEMNDWNTALRYGKAWLDEEGDPFIELDLDLSGGSSDGQVRKYVAMWDAMLSGFHEYIDY